MKNVLFAVAGGLAAAMVAVPALADAVPAPITKALKVYAPERTMFDQGQLVVVLPQPRITDKIYGAVLGSVCGTVWLKEDWGGAKVREIYVLNQHAAQGYVFEGGKVECDAMGPMKRDEANAYEAAHTRAETCTRGLDYCLGRKK